MSLEKVRVLNTIIERDATDTTYKYALLRGVSDICQHYTHFMEKENGRVWFPIGLLIEKWLLYYYSIFDQPSFIPQKPCEQDLDKPGKKLSFRRQFKKITSYYEDKGRLSSFYNDYRRGHIPHDINYELLDLLKKLRYTITRYPMKHLGYSVTKEHYTIFNFTKGDRIRKQPVTSELVINKFGKFSISQEYFEIFNLFGGFISGEHSIIKKWAEFTVISDKSRSLTIEEMLEILTRQPVTDRDVKDIAHYFEFLLDKKGYLECVWSGMKIKSTSELHIDHVIPFSVWRNNDLWNLLPTHQDTNLSKRDDIPSSELLKKRYTSILKYWIEIRSQFPERFDSEIRFSLTGTSGDENDLLKMAFAKLVEKVEYLIKQYGYKEWNK